MASVFDHDVSSLQRVRDVSRSFTISRAQENPFSTMVKKGPKPKSTLFEFPFKTRHTPADVFIGDGQDVADADLINNEANKTMIQARIQKGWVPFGVGDIAQEFVEEYGVSNLVADNAEDAMVLAKEQLELMCLKNSDSRAGTGSTAATASKTRGLTAWIASAAQADLPVNAMALTPAANIVTGKAAATDVTEDDFRGVMQSVATNARKTGFSWDVFLSPSSKANFSNFSRTQTVSAATVVPLRRFNAGQADGKMTLNVLIYESDFGNLRLHTHFSLPTGVHALIVDMDHVALRPGRPPRTGDLPYNGGSIKKLIDYIYGLEVNNPRCHGKITT